MGGYAVLKGASYTLAFTPDMVIHNGTTQTTERTVNPDSEYLKDLPKHLRSYEEALSYLPNQVYIGNKTPDDLAAAAFPWYDKKIEGLRQGKYGEIMPEDEFIGLMQICDVFDLVKLEQSFADKTRKKLEAHPLITAEQAAILDKNEETLEDIRRLVEEDHAEPLYCEGQLVGAVKRAHDIDINLSAHVMLENLVTKASCALSLLHLVQVTGIDASEIEYVIDCYKNSARRNAPFIAVNCSAIPESLLESELFGYEKGAFTGASEKGRKGYFELANKGVLFLDEIGDMPLSFQAKLLRVLQENEVMRIGGKEMIPIDVQVIAASNKSLADKVAAGEFRSDLFYRLNTFPILIPPLRARKRDIVPLIYMFVDSFNSKYKTNKMFSLSSLNVLQRYEWPGNVRELENLVERIILTSKEDIITDEHVKQMLFFPKSAEEDAFLMEGTLKEVIEKTEKRVIKKYMEQYQSPTELEQALGLSRATLNRKILKYGLRESTR